MFFAHLRRPESNLPVCRLKVFFGNLTATRPKLASLSVARSSYRLPWEQGACRREHPQWRAKDGANQAGDDSTCCGAVRGAVGSPGVLIGPRSRCKTCPVADDWSRLGVALFPFWLSGCKGRKVERGVGVYQSPVSHSVPLILSEDSGKCLLDYFVRSLREVNDRFARRRELRQGIRREALVFSSQLLFYCSACLYT